MKMNFSKLSKISTNKIAKLLFPDIKIKCVILFRRSIFAIGVCFTEIEQKFEEVKQFKC